MRFTHVVTFVFLVGLLLPIGGTCQASENGTNPPASVIIQVESAPAKVTLREVTDPVERETVRKSFQQELAHMGSTGVLSSCDRIVQVDRIDEPGNLMISGRDYSYGASCTLKVGQANLSLLICNDVMIGKFTVTGSGSHTREWFAHFIRENCPPGG